MRARTLAVTALACLLGACTDTADPMSMITASADDAPSLARKRRKAFGDLAADPNAATLTVGDSLRVTTRAKAWGGRTVVPEFVGFRSADPAIATVDSTGLVIGHQAGAVLIHAYAVSEWVNYAPDSVFLTVRNADGTEATRESSATTTTAESSAGTQTESSTTGETSQTSTTGESSPSSTTTTSTTTENKESSGSTTTSTSSTSSTTTTSGTTTSGTSSTTTTTTTTSSQPAPPPSGTPATSAGFPNQPSGMYIMTDRAFDSKASDNNDRGSTGSDGWDGIEYKYGKFTIARDGSAPSGDGLVGQMYYPADHQSGTAPATVQTVVFSNAPHTLYVSIWAKLSSNWVGNQSGTNKMFFVGASGGNNQFFLSAEGVGQGPLMPQVRLQGIEDPRARIVPNLASGIVLQRGQWHRWEFVLTCNSAPSKSDGTIDFWLDGKHVTSVSDVNWTQTKYPTRPCDFPIFHWSPTYGGGGASPGADMYLWFDRVYVSGR